MNLLPANCLALYVKAGGLGPIIALLNRPDSSLVRRCLIALYFIGADKDALQQAIGAAGALPKLLLLARSDSPDVQAEAADVLKVLCRYVWSASSVLTVMLCSTHDVSCSVSIIT